MRTKRDYTCMSAVDVYKLVVNRELKKFPNGYLDKTTIKEIVRYLVIDVYGYDRAKVCTNVDNKFFFDNYLGGIRKFFNSKIYDIINYCFPEWDIKPWETSKVPNSFWQDENNLKEFILWVFAKEDVDVNSKESIRKINTNVIQLYGGTKPFVYAGGLYGLLKLGVGTQYKEWEITRMSVWTEEKITEATRWLVEEKLKYTPKQACKLRHKDFINNNLDGMIQKGMRYLVIDVLNIAYPGKYIMSSNGNIMYLE